LVVLAWAPHPYVLIEHPCLAREVLVPLVESNIEIKKPVSHANVNLMHEELIEQDQDHEEPRPIICHQSGAVKPGWN